MPIRDSLAPQAAPCLRRASRRTLNKVGPLKFSTGDLNSYDTIAMADFTYRVEARQQRCIHISLLSQNMHVGQVQ
jgi:hypothetical protein